MLWTVIVLAVVLTAAWFAALAALPSVVNSVLADFRLGVSWEHLAISPFRGTVEIRGVEFHDSETLEPIGSIESVRARADLAAILGGRIKFHRGEVDGLDIFIEREAAGDFPFFKRFIPDETQDETEGGGTNPVAPNDEPRVDPVLPVEITEARVSGLHVRYLDRTLSPPAETDLDLSVRADNFGSATRQGKVTLLAGANRHLESLRVDGEITAKIGELAAAARVRIRGLDTRALRGLLGPAGIVPTGTDVGIALNAATHIHSSGRDGRGVASAYTLDATRISVAGREAFSVGHLGVRTTSPRPDTTFLSGVKIKSFRLAARLTESGGLRIAGLDLTPAGTEGVRPASDLRLDIQELSLDPVRKSGPPGGPLALHASLACENLFESLRVDGRLADSKDASSVSFRVDLQGLAPSAAAPYLAEAGLESTLEHGSLHLQGRLAADRSGPGAPQGKLELDAIRILDGDKELLAIKTFHAAFEAPGEKTRVPHVTDVLLSGLAGRVEHNNDGSWSFLGLRTRPRPPSPREDAVQAKPVDIGRAIAEALRQAPPFELTRLVAKDNRLVWNDTATTPPRTLEIEDFGLTINDLKTRRAAGPDGFEGRFRVWLQAPEMARKIEVEGELACKPSGHEVRLSVAAEGLKEAWLLPRAASPGASSLLEDPSVELQLNASLRPEGRSTAIQATVENLACGNDHLKWLELERASLAGLRISSRRIRAESLQVDGLRVPASRRRDGSVVLLGMRLWPTPGRTDHATGEEPAREGSPGGAAGGTSGSGGGLAFSVGRLTVRGGTLGWRDEAVTPAVRVASRVDLALQDLAVKDGAASASLSLNVQAPGVAERFALKGRVQTGPSGQDVDIRLDSSGIRLTAIEPYLASTAHPLLKDGKLGLRLTASRAPCKRGGERERLEVRDLDFRDGDSPWLALESCAVNVDRHDAEAGVLEVSEVSVKKIASQIRITSGGSAAILGLRFDGSSPPAPLPPREAGDSESPVSSPFFAALYQNLVREYPRLDVEKVSVGIQRLQVIDESRPGAVPLTLEECRIENLSTIQARGAKPQGQPPIRFRLEGRLDPLADRVSIESETTLFAQEPAWTGKIAVDGIHGGGLTRWRPELAAKLDAGGIKNGRLRAELRLSLSVSRRQPTSAFFSSIRGLEVSLDDLEFLREEGGERLAGLENLHVLVSRFSPKRKILHVREASIIGPSAIVRKVPGGEEWFGVLFKEPAAEPAPEGDTRKPPEASVLPSAAREGSHSLVAATARDDQEPRISVDRIYISGVDFLYEDRSTPSVVRIPIVSLDAEVRGFTTAPTNKKPCTFDLVARGGEVDVPWYTPENFVKKMVSSVKDMVAGGGGKTSMVSRPIFDLIRVSGSYDASTRSIRKVQASLRGFQLAAYAAAASHAGVDLDAGVLDADTTIEAISGDTLDIASNLAFGNLKVSEKKNGPIARSLRLPAPLETVVFTLRDRHGTVKIPVHFQMQRNKVSRSEFTLAATAALSAATYRALRGSPVRVVAGAVGIVESTGLLSLPGTRQLTRIFEPAEDLPSGGKPVVLEFAAGDAALRRSQKAELQPVAEALRKDQTLFLDLRGEISNGDMTRCESLARPDEGDTREMVIWLSEESRRAEREYAMVSALARLAGATGQDAEATRLRKRLQALNRSLAQKEDVIDRLNRYLENPRGSQMFRKKRSLAVDLAESRAAAVRMFLLDSGVEDVDARLHVPAARFSKKDAEAGGTVSLSLVRIKP